VHTNDIGIIPWDRLEGVCLDLSRLVTVMIVSICLGDNLSLEQTEREHLARVVFRALSFEAAAAFLALK
jgi:hypothetical protein